jgi:predicted nucleic acid-binding protein
MNKIIIDTNIVFSALLNTNSRIGQILINGANYYNFYSPEYLRFEIFEHKSKIKSIAKLNEDEFLELYEMVMRNITVINHSIIPVDIYKKAILLCKTIDPDDTAFVALATFINGNLWSGDIKLINGLAKQKFNRIIKTNELFDDFIQRMNS